MFSFSRHAPGWHVSEATEGACALCSQLCVARKHGETLVRDWDQRDQLKIISGEGRRAMSTKDFLEIQTLSRM